ncbi:unnamed protein product [Adineta steineri]|uniref:Uncharacterized protein n=1 Tax=Adineta steineri TaxID=433720 RepID=A0A818U8B0_9BILA|nr:unnamed protein product [Adineta steineri]
MEPQTSNPSPFLRANKWSRFFHGWITELLKKSHKQGTLDLTDLYDIPSYLDATKLTDKLEANWFDEMKRSPREPSLVRATVRTLGWTPLLIGLLLIPISLLNIIQPLILTFLMNFFEPCSTMSNWTAWSLAISIVCIAFCASFISHQNIYRTILLALEMRIAYSGLIYRKVLRLSTHSMNNISSGKIMNLLSNDAGQIELALYFINNLWKTPLEIILVTCFFWKYVQYMIFIALGYALLLLIVQTICSQLILHFRTKILLVTDERVKIMSEIIKSMRIIKMYCWESAFSKKVRLIRKREIIQCAFRLILDCIQTLFTHTYTNVAFVLMYTTMWSLDIRFDTKFFAISMCMLVYIRANVIHSFTIAIRNFVHYMAAQNRIRTFLLLDECERDNRLLSTSYLNLVTKSNTIENELISKDRLPQIICNINRALWEKDGTFALKNIVFNANPGDLICVIGPVGSGKSSLLQSLSGEIAYFEGKIRLHGSFCYVPQESWIFSSSIKNNILFGKDYDHKLFQRVIHASALQTDIEQWSHGIETLVGDQGLMLSGGQKARVNMARALYRDAAIYLLDDPLSAVDVKVSKHLFEKSIKKYLRKKICILTTHQIQFLQDATMIIVLNNGEVVHMGTYEKLITSSDSFAHLLHDINQHELNEQQSVDLQNQRSIVELKTSESNDKKDTLILPTNVEIKQEGAIKWHVYTAYLRTGIGLFIGLILMTSIFSIRELIVIFSDRWLGKWTEDETHRYRVFSNCTNTSINPILLVNNTEWNNHRYRRFYIYCGSVLVLFVVTLIRVVVTEFVFLNAGRVLHNKMFHRFVRAPISFFDINPIGRMSNRFTKDVSVMDDSLPINLFELFQCIFKVLGTVVLVSWINPWSFIPAIIAVGGMIFIRYRFARCLRDLKRLEGISRSPIYSYMTSTIHGLKVIRSYHAEQMCSAEFLSHLNNGSRVNFLILTVNRWAAIRFDWITVSFIGLVTFFAMIVRVVQNYLTAADIALILSYSLNLMGTLQWTIRLSVDVETQMTAVERVLEYCSLEQEPPAQVSSDHRPPSNWPSEGRIVFNNISMSYSSDEHAPFVLRNITMTIKSAEKIGIVGRTGAGKSSLIQILFRMGILVDGQIKIDNIDITSVGLDDIRSRISIIPQEPVLFTGTMRNNLDPFGEYSDAEIWQALEQVQLKTLVADDMPNGLESIVTESGSNLSVGQKQLVCLARAILKKSKILVVDEATANVDNATDELIQRAIRDKFRECTVLTVAHRLRTVIDSDRILVLGNGELLEFDTPDELLSNPSSQFAMLVEQSGPAEAEYLRSLARATIIHSQLEEDKLNCNDDFSEYNNEDDPLLLSHNKT